MSFEAEELVPLYPRLRAFAVRLMKNADDADDLLHDAIEKALTRRNQFERGTNLFAWVCTVMKNLFFDRPKKAHRKYEQSDADGAWIDFQRVSGGQDARIDLIECVAFLGRMNGAGQATLLVALGESYEDAAIITGRKHVKSAIFRTRETLLREFA